MRNLFDDSNKKMALSVLLAVVVVGACITEILVMFLGMDIVKAIFLGQLGAYAGTSILGLTGALLAMAMDA